MKVSFAILLGLLVLLGGCCNVTVGDEDAALAEANIVVKMLYVDKDVEKAYARFDPEFKKLYTSGVLRKLINDIEGEYGVLEELKPDSYIPIAGADGMNIFYVGRYEKGVLNHKVVLVGSMQTFKVTGVYFSEGPFTGQGKMKFEDQPIIK